MGNKTNRRATRRRNRVCRAIGSKMDDVERMRKSRSQNKSKRPCEEEVLLERIYSFVCGAAVAVVGVVAPYTICSHLLGTAAAAAAGQRKRRRWC